MSPLHQDLWDLGQVTKAVWAAAFHWSFKRLSQLIHVEILEQRLHRVRPPQVKAIIIFLPKLSGIPSSQLMTSPQAIGHVLSSCHQSQTLWHQHPLSLSSCRCDGIVPFCWRPIPPLYLGIPFQFDDNRNCWRFWRRKTPNSCPLLLSW